MFLNAAWTKPAVPAEVLDTLGCAVNPIFWYKNDQNVAGPATDLTWACEVIVAGFKKSKELAENRVNLDGNPTKRLSSRGRRFTNSRSIPTARL